MKKFLVKSQALENRNVVLNKQSDHNLIDLIEIVLTFFIFWTVFGKIGYGILSKKTKLIWYLKGTNT